MSLVRRRSERTTAGQVQPLELALADWCLRHGGTEPVALAMARGALARTPSGRGADWAVAVTGIAGPTGGSPAKPVGTVWIAWTHRDGAAHAQCHRFEGDRAAVRAATVDHALAGLRRRLAPL